ncbi:putative RNA-binding protein YlxR (DUF448 family) [Trueperella bonasi]|uniref:RNA-binding protein YlxR (DUF448 family) n=1 Tax=Trueperella bonasi TaxID=312286 RepID=A0ABT9NHT8_9ACTO|nr:YlxR family protein [Trueperella bonasi]MDP9806963.1 putative RNA-binding protein YlxR (DUF448 family) [Trueperella bonasi]
MSTSLPRAIKQRTCIGCRGVGHANELLRFTVSNAYVVCDTEKKRGGRGAWVHPTPECLGQALSNRAFNRAFRSAVDARDVHALLDMTKERKLPEKKAGREPMGTR